MHEQGSGYGAALGIAATSMASYLEKDVAARKVAARLQPEQGADVPASPVMAALGRLRMELGDAHYEAEALTNDLRMVLSDAPAEPSTANQCGRGSMESELAEAIQQQVDSVMALLRKLRGTRERLTL